MYSQIIKVIKSVLNGGKRTVSAFGIGGTNRDNIIIVTPFGFDSAPVGGFKGILSETTDSGKPIFLGVTNDNQNNVFQVSSGSTRIYATDTNGNITNTITIDSDGKISIGIDSSKNVIFSGGTNHLTQFESLQEALNNWIGDIHTPNTLLFAINAGVVSGGGSFTPPTAFDMSASQTSNILIP